MGIFSSKKETYVSSVVYNMAGDEFKRPNYLKTTVSNAVVGDAPSISDAIVGSYLNGPAMRFRSFLRWTDRSDYSDKIGLVTGSIKTGNSIDTEALEGQLPGSNPLLQGVEIGDADFTYWVDQYVMVHFPAEVGTGYTATFDINTGVVIITFDDDSLAEFTISDFDKSAQYLYALYTVDTGNGRMTPRVFIYKQLSGNAVLDAMFLQESRMLGFYPPIPFRLDNKFLGPDYLPDIYEAAKKGYKKATTGKYDDLIEELKKNENLGEIDYAYIVFGVCLNVLEQSSRKYIYRFFEEILNDYTLVGETEFAAWQETWNKADTWAKWKAAQGDTSNPLNGTPEPERVAYPPTPSNSIKVSTGNNPTMNFDMTISWHTMVEQKGTGKLKPDAKRDTLWFEKGDAQDFQGSFVYDSVDGGGSPLRQMLEAITNRANVVILNWQVTDNTWRRLVIVGLKHTNMIYGGKAVEIDAVTALEDPEESGFIIPLHDGIYRSMGMKDSTQMTTACSFMVFNCYQVVKKKWYQRGIFKVILVIIIIVIFIYTGYISPEGVGLLGSNAAVGAAIVGTAAGITLATIVGAIANYVAAMIVVRLITAASVELFGEKWGAIVATVASIFVLQIGTNMAAGQSFSASFNNLMSAQNILRLTMAVGDAYAGYMQGATLETVQEINETLALYKTESQNIKAAWEKTLGFDNGIIDPRLVTSAFGVIAEEPKSFLQRTLMTGTDVADMSIGMLTNFARITLSTDLPT